MSGERTRRLDDRSFNVVSHGSASENFARDFVPVCALFVLARHTRAAQVFGQ
jgi:hypothetical protein